MWWLYGALLVVALVYAVLSPPPRRLAIAAGLFLLAIVVHVVGSSYLGMLYASAQKDASGNVVWTLDLADRVRDITAVMYVNGLLFALALFLVLWTALGHAWRSVGKWARW
jgi:hypothetical protein